LAHLSSVEQLGSDPTLEIREKILEASQDTERLFPASVVRSNVERDLNDWPQPPNCPLTLQNAEDWIQKANALAQEMNQYVLGELEKKAALLQSDTFQERLKQGQDHEFIAGLLKKRAVNTACEYLIQSLGPLEVGQAVEPVELLSRYLKKLSVRKVRLADFKPSKRTLEKRDIELIVGEFCQYLLDNLDSGDDELPVIEIE